MFCVVRMHHPYYSGDPYVSDVYGPFDTREEAEAYIAQADALKRRDCEVWEMTK